MEKIQKFLDEVMEVVSKFNPAHDEVKDAPNTSRKSVYAPILKASEDYGFVLSPVLVPEVADLQGDIISKEAIEKAAHDFMCDWQTVGLMHKTELAKRQVKVVESYIQRGNGEIAGTKIPDGTWLVAMRIIDPALREAIKSGKIKGVSVGGIGEREA